MNPAIVKIDSNEYSFKYDQAKPDAKLWFGIVELLVLDEMTALPVREQITISGDRPGLTQIAQRPGKDGFTGLVGIPEIVFREIDLSLAAQTITINCESPGYLPMSFDIMVGPVAGYPEVIGSALPVNAGAVLLHHEPLVFVGRITASTGPVASATVQLDEFMLNVVTPVTSFVADVRHPVALKAACYSSRNFDDECRLVNIANGSAANKTLVTNALHSNTHINISDAIGLAVGDLLEIDVGDLSEMIEIANIEEVADVEHINHSNIFADITLAYPLSHKHQSGVLIQHRTATVAGGIKLLKIDAVRGDSTLLMNDVTGWSANDVIRIHSAGSVDEYHTIDFYQTTTDGNGYYRLPAMNRLGQLTISANQGLLSGSADKIIPYYSERNNLVDIVVTGP